MISAVLGVWLDHSYMVCCFISKFKFWGLYLE